MRCSCVRLLAALGVLPATASPATAQDNYEIQVYGAQTMEPGSTMFELHSNFTFNGRRAYDGTVAPTWHQLHETVEVTQGLTSWSEVGFYFFSSDGGGLGYQFVGSHVRPRVRVPDSWGWPVGLSLSMEMGFQKDRYSEDTWSWEIRPIIDKEMGRLYWSINPTLERAWKGPNTAHGVSFTPNVKLGWQVNPVVNAGIEYYGGLGQVGDFDALHDQEHAIYGAVDLDVSPDWEVNFGLGVGATASTDRTVLKLILGRHVFWGGAHP